MCELVHPILGYICHHSAPEYFKNWNDPSQIWKGKESNGFGLQGKHVFDWFCILPALYLQVYLFQMESQAECARPQLVCRL